MAMVIRVRFKRAAKLYDFDPNGLDLHNGMSVVTETARGVELGECMSGIMDMPDERLVLPLKPIIRIATEQALATQKRNEQAEKEAFDIAIDRIAEHKLEMKLVDVEYAFGHSNHLLLYGQRPVDFRMLVRAWRASSKPASSCARSACATSEDARRHQPAAGRFLPDVLGDFTPVSIKMAKSNLSQSTKISGLCDRLMS
ncbi:MAG: PSP1 C-terminal domain-containing protein [Christensenellales bacterium]